MARHRLLLVAATLVAATGCAIDNAGTAVDDAREAIDAVDPGGRSADVQRLCALTALPLESSAQRAAAEPKVLAAVNALRQYTPADAPIVKAASELLTALQVEVHVQSVDPNFGASFGAFTKEQVGTSQQIRGRLAAACGTRLPG